MSHIISQIHPARPPTKPYHINGLPFEFNFDTISGNEIVYLVINNKSKEKK